MFGTPALELNGLEQLSLAPSDQSAFPILLCQLERDVLPHAAAGAGYDCCSLHKSNTRITDYRSPKKIQKRRSQFNNNRALRISGIRNSSFQFHPLSGFRRFHRRVRHGLRARAVVKIWRARPLVADGVDKFVRLVVTKGYQWIALARVARRAGHFPEFFRNRDGFESRTAGFAGLQFVPLAGDEDK